MADIPQRRSINRTHGPDAPHGEFHVVGKRVRKVDGIHKATGQAVYADDIQLPGMLHAKTLRSPHPHARILSIDTAAALALPGVRGVITGRDMPIKYGVIPWTQDENALALDKVRFVGDEVAAVAAVDEDTANAAVNLIRVEYEVLEAFLDPEKALRQGSPAIHDNSRPASGGKPAVPANNISKQVKLEFGDVDAALAGSAHVVEDDYVFHGTAHAPIEPHCAVAQVDGNGVLTLWSSTQIPHYVHRALARVLEIPAHRIRVIQPNLGGAFGGKSDPFYFEFCACLLALRTGRPVKFLLTREETFYTHRGRHPMQMHFRAGCDAAGRVTAVDSRILIDGGSYSSFGLVTTYYSGQLLCGPTHFPTYRFDSTRVFTNKPPCGPKRGHGSVQPRFALEIQLDRLAVKAGLDPIEFRRRNCLPANARTVNGQLVTSNGFLQCLDAVERASGWKDKRGKLNGVPPAGAATAASRVATATPDGRRVLRGIGVAGSMYISGTNYAVYPNDMPQAGVMVRLDRSGLAMVYTGTSDIGQGSNSVMAMIVAEELGLRLEQVRVVAAASASNSGGVETSETTSAINTTGANLIVLSINAYDAAAPYTVTDNKSNTWTPLTPKSAGGAGAKLYYCTPGTVGSGHTFTISGGTFYGGLNVIAFSGAASSSPFDVEAGATTGGATTLAAGSITPSANGAVVVYATTMDASSISSVSVGTLEASWAFVGGVRFGGGIGYDIQTTASATNPLWTYGASAAAGAVIAAFKAPAAAGLFVNPLSGRGGTMAQPLRMH